MDLTEKNGQPSMEEILASIRRIVAEEPDGPNQIIDLSRPSLVGDGVLEDAADFQLPSIFRPAVAPAATEKASPLFGRLTDAIRGASGGVPVDLKPAQLEPELRKGVEHEETVLAGHPMARSAHEAGLQTVDGLSSLKPLRMDYDMTASPVMSMSSGPQDSGVAPVEEVPRIMTSFKDSRFSNLLTGASPAPTPSAAASATAEIPRVDFSTIVPSHLDRTAFVPAQPAQPVPPSGAAPVVFQAPSAVAASPSQPTAPLGAAPPARPPQSPADSIAASAGSVDDATADLLRPMLRQWLADNMPRMVEKALHIEVAETVKSTKKGDVG